MLQLFQFRHHSLHSTVGSKLPRQGKDDVSNFYSALAQGLENLEKAAGTDFLSFRFVCSAIDLLRSTHAGALLLVEKLRLPISACGEEWLNEYMDETVKLLEVCNVLKSSLSRLEQYYNLVEVARRTLESAGNVNNRHQLHRGIQTLNVCKQEMSQVETDHKILIETKIESGCKLQVSLADKHVENKFVKWNGFWGVLFALKNTNSYICRLLLCAFVYMSPIPTFNTELVSLKSLWSFSLVCLHQRVSDEISKTRNYKRCPFMLSNEVEILESALTDLRSQVQPVLRGSVWSNDDVEKFKRKLTTLKDGSRKLQSGLETGEWHINDLFDDVVDGRNKLLNLFNSCE